MSIDVLLPTRRQVSLEELTAEIARRANDDHLAVGDGRARTVLEEVSSRLLGSRAIRRFPELGALGFFLRRSELSRIVERSSPAGELVLVPRGLVVHFPPANVDTIFAYSWSLSLLAGNRNVVRLSSRAGPAATALVELLADVLAQADPAVRDSQRVVTYAHDDAITAGLIAIADVRVAWGGDRAVNALRSAPLTPLARDVAFPDRSSFAAINVAALAGADNARREALAEQLATDVFWFDQAACSSPRVVFWVGDLVQALGLRASLMAQVATAAKRRGFTLEPAMAVEQRVQALRLAGDGVATKVEFVGNMLASFELEPDAPLPRGWLGSGVLAHVDIATLAEVERYLTRRDQTLTHFGFTPEELRVLLDHAGDRAPDRMVPIGHALSFEAIWDGHDLLREFTRTVVFRP